MTPLVEAVKKMAHDCKLQNAEQIGEELGAIGAVRMIASEYLELKKRYLELLKKQ